MDKTSFSMIIDDKEPSKFNTYDKLQPRKLKTWVKDDSVSECYLCLKQFSIFLRKHHCRSCYHIFCYHCSRFKEAIPESIQNLSKNLNNVNYFRDGAIDWYKWLSNKKNAKKERVCETCYAKLGQLKNMSALIKIFENVELTIFDYKKIGCVCKLWRQLSNYYLSQFREIQYYLPNHKFTEIEKNLLWANRRQIIGHSKYLIQLLNSIDYENYQATTHQLKDISQLLKENNKITTCQDMLCTRQCRSQISSEDALTLLNQRIKSKFIRKYAMKLIAKSSSIKINAYLPFLIHKISHETIEDSVVGKFLVEYCNTLTETDLQFCNQVYWQLKVSSEDPEHKILYQYFIEKMETELPPHIVKKIQALRSLKCFLEKAKDHTTPLDFLKKNIVSNHIPIPTNPSLETIGLDAKQFKIIDSATKPIVVPFILVTSVPDESVPGESSVPDESDESEEPSIPVYKILYKTDDVRKDLIVMSLIRLMDQILKDELNLDLHIISYNILPVSKESGFVDMVSECETVYKIREKLNYSILNYIIDKNPSENVEHLRYRFMKSCAAYCVITYLLGIGDRHLSNIMMTDEGYLFHIDFGFVLGYDPKPIREVSMRIFPDMVDALGGVNSQYYNEFKKICTQTFNCWRKHLNLFVNYLTLLSDLRPAISTNVIYAPEFFQDKIIEEILRRFIPGQNCNQAELTLYNCIDSSTQAYHHTVTDFFHYHQQENTLNSIIYNTYNSTKNVMNEICRIISYNND